MTDLSTITVTITDARKAGYCVAGVRRWWPQQSYAMSFADFLRTGMAADAFLAGGDECARLTVEAKLEREANG